MQFSAILSFQADNMEHAKEIVASWSVTAGTVIGALSSSEIGVQTPVTITEDGPIVDALLVHAQRSGSQPLPGQPQPPPPPPVRR